MADEASAAPVIASLGSLLAPVRAAPGTGWAVFDWPVFAVRDEFGNTDGATAVSGNVLANDYFRNGIVDVSVVAGPGHGTVSIDDNGNFTYQVDFSDPDLVWMIAKGTVRDSFVYRVEDTRSDFGYARVHVTLEIPDFGFSIPRLESAGGEVSYAGDVNGDGIADIIVGDAYYSLDGAPDAGAAFLIFGSEDGFDEHIDLNALDGTDGVRLTYAENNLFLGDTLDSAGDINGDGIDDFLIGSLEFIDFYGPDAGRVFVVFGQEGEAPFGADFDLASLDGTNGFAIEGFPAEDLGNYDSAQGVSTLRGVGDINGDGLNDFIVRTDPYGVYFGVTPDFVVFGNSEFDAELDLDSLDGTNGFAVETSVIDDVGDVNGDGRVDLLFWLEKEFDPDPDVYFVAFGPVNPEGNAVLTEEQITSGGGAFITMGAFDSFTVASIGDVDGDGIGDMAVQSTGFDSATDYFGATYIVYGVNLNAEHTFYLDVVEGKGVATTAIPHLVQYNQWSSVSAAGDINGDGIDDFLISETYADTSSGESTGQVYLVFGRQGGWGSEIDLSTLDGAAGYVFVGAKGQNDVGADLSAAGDINADGFDDFIIQGGLHFEDFVVYGGPDGLQWMDAADGSLDGQISLDLLYSGDAFF